MIKSESNNSFNDGLMMDLNPLVTPNNVMTNCLNGTLVTFNGNEYMLQNDMGNGRVETAYLPEGYIPMGTCELGGIIYIVSYNPLKGTCQVGSFPSPERNITTDEREGTTVVTLSNEDFQWGSTETGAGIYYLKKDLDSTLKFYPGDKFVVYSNNILKNTNKLKGLSTNIKKETVRLSLGTVTSDGKLVVFDEESLKKFKIGDNNEYYIKEHSGGSMSGTDIDEYRSLVQQPYNIFSSKVSGTLVLVAELVQFSQFSAEIHHRFKNNKGTKMYSPTASFVFDGNYEYIPYGVMVKLTLLDKDGQWLGESTIDIEQKRLTTKGSKIKGGTHHQTDEVAFLDNSDILSPIFTNNPNYFNTQERKPYTLNYEFIPCMAWGPVNHLSIKGSIALDKVGSGYIGVSAWKYYNSDTKCNLTWGLEVYEEEDCSVTGVEMSFIKLISEDKTETMTYAINSKGSYHGTFYELVPLNEKYYRFNIENDEAMLESNKLYLVKIEVKYKRDNGTEEPKCFYRWLYTNSVFNDHFYEYPDYNILKLDMFQADLDLSYSVKSTLTPSQYNGFIRGEKKDSDEVVDSINTLCAIKNYTQNTAKCTAKVVLKDDYRTFRINGSQLNIELDEKLKPILEVNSKVKYTDREDPEMYELLENEMLETFSDESLPANATSIEEGLSGKDFVHSEDTPAKYGNAVRISSYQLGKEYDQENDLFTFDVNYDIVAIAKAYATMNVRECSSRGKLVPLAYDDNTFADYDLQYDGKWKPKLLGTFGFKEKGGDQGYCYVGSLTSAGLKDFEFCHGNDVDFNWTWDNLIVSREQQAGWTTPIMFVAHCCTNVNGPAQTFYSRDTIKVTAKNGFTKEEWNLSEDSRNRGERNVVFVLMKSNIGNYYYPLNCARKGNAYGLDDTLALEGFTGAQWTDFYTSIATVLNNLYRFIDQQETKTYFIPAYIYYGDNYVYTTQIFLKANLKEGEYGTIQLKVDNGKFVDINRDLINLFYPNILNEGISQEDIDILANNVTTTITDKISGSTLSISSVTKDNTSGIKLRNHLLDQQSYDLGIIVTNYNGIDDGNTIVSLPSGNKKALFCMDDGVLKDAKSFNPVALQYKKEEGKIVATAPANGKRLFSKPLNNIESNFILNDKGLLLVKNPPKSELSVIRFGNDDTGVVTGYLRRGLDPDYEFWQ